MKTATTVDRKTDHSDVDMKGLCEEQGLEFFSYREYSPGQEDKPKEDREWKQAYFVHEAWLKSGVQFYSKREMGDAICNFACSKLSPGKKDETLITFAGRRGLRVLFELDSEQLVLREQARVEKQRRSKLESRGK